MIKQRRYAGAVAAVNELAARDDENASTLNAKDRLDVLTKQYSVALVGMEKLAPLLKAQANQVGGAAASTHAKGMVRVALGYSKEPPPRPSTQLAQRRIARRS